MSEFLFITTFLLQAQFGCNAEAKYMNCSRWVQSMASSIDNILAAGWTQWDWAPQWNARTKDVFNLEDVILDPFLVIVHSPFSFVAIAD
jgi:hypothetical protein